jgi:membrane fusion protein (multidrug efflux system)
VGANQGANAIVLEGLSEGDLVITQGLQKVRPGQTVIAQPAESAISGQMPTKPEASAAAATAKDSSK